MEIVGHQPNKVHGTIHWDANGHANYGGSKTSTSDLSEEFHVFSIIWDANEIKWLLDGIQYHNVDIAPADLDEFREAFFFIFNVAVGGNWPGNPDATTSFPQRMIVDYMRVFQ
jgi:beta-glucanase (GH16 family)